MHSLSLVAASLAIALSAVLLRVPFPPRLFIAISRRSSIRFVSLAMGRADLQEFCDPVRITRTRWVKGIEVRPGNPTGFPSRQPGEELAKLGDGEHAVQRHRDSLVFRPDGSELHAQLGATLTQLGRFKEAKIEFESVLGIDPNSQGAQQALARMDTRERLSNKQ